MRITGKSSAVGSTQGVGGAKAPAAAAPVTAAVSADALHVSEASRLVVIARSALAEVPDVRVEKVEALKAALDKDTYDPDGEAVADGLIREHFPVRT